MGELIYISGYFLFIIGLSIAVYLTLECVLTTKNKYPKGLSGELIIKPHKYWEKLSEYRYVYTVASIKYKLNFNTIMSTIFINMLLDGCFILEKKDNNDFYLCVNEELSIDDIEKIFLKLLTRSDGTYVSTLRELQSIYYSNKLAYKKIEREMNGYLFKVSKDDGYLKGCGLVGYVLAELGYKTLQDFLGYEEYMIKSDDMILSDIDDHVRVLSLFDEHKARAIANRITNWEEAKGVDKETFLLIIRIFYDLRKAVCRSWN